MGPQTLAPINSSFWSNISTPVTQGVAPLKFNGMLITDPKLNLYAEELDAQYLKAFNKRTAELECLMDDSPENYPTRNWTIVLRPSKAVLSCHLLTEPAHLKMQGVLVGINKDNSPTLHVTSHYWIGRCWSLEWWIILVMIQGNEDFTFDCIMKNYSKYLRGSKENKTKYKEILCRGKRDWMTEIGESNRMKIEPFGTKIVVNLSSWLSKIANSA